MRQDDRNTFPVEKSFPQMLLAGGRKVQTFAVTSRAVWERAHWVQMGWKGSRSTFSIHSPTSASLAAYEPPSLPLWADSWPPAGGKVYLGAAPGLGGEWDMHRPAASFSPRPFAPALPRFTDFSKAPADTGMSMVLLSSFRFASPAWLCLLQFCLTGRKAQEQRGAGGQSSCCVSGWLWQHRFPLNASLQC